MGRLLSFGAQPISTGAVLGRGGVRWLDEQAVMTILDLGQGVVRGGESYARKWVTTVC